MAKDGKSRGTDRWLDGVAVWKSAATKRQPSSCLAAPESSNSVRGAQGDLAVLQGGLTMMQAQLEQTQEKMWKLEEQQQATQKLLQQVAGFPNKKNGKGELRG